jgi:hypothetical protein
MSFRQKMPEYIQGHALTTMYRRLPAAVLALANGQACMAQVLEKAYILAEPLQYTQQGQFRGCGLNLKLLQETAGSTRDYATVSINFWLDSPGVALVKTTLNKATPGGSTPLKPVPIETSWVRLQGEDPLPPKQQMRGDNLSLLAVVELGPALEFVTTTIQDPKEVQLGFKQQGAQHERTLHGLPTLTPETRDQVTACFDVYINRLGKASRP